jgi:hypothetical protein
LSSPLVRIRVAVRLSPGTAVRPDPIMSRYIEAYSGK